MSDRSSAAIASAVLLDARRAGLITADAEELVIDPSRLRRERTRMREEESAKARQLLRKPLSVFFDDRKDNTQMFVSNGGRWRRRIKKEVHTSLVAEPGGHYLGHVVPRSGKSSDISASIANTLASTVILLPHCKQLEVTARRSILAITMASYGS